MVSTPNEGNELVLLEKGTVQVLMKELVLENKLVQEIEENGPAIIKQGF